MGLKKINLLLSFCAFASCHSVTGQELFILNEPASSVPKNVLGFRFLYHNYEEARTDRRLYSLRALYGVTSKLSVLATVAISNHHDRKLPRDLFNHTHVGSQTNYYTQAIRRGRGYPYLFTGINLFAKYRFLTRDSKYKHFRMAAYGEWSNANVAHDEAEPNLMDDTAGYGGGLITTYLRNRLAFSLTTGMMIPRYYSEYQPDVTGGPDLLTVIHYGRGLKYNLSIGYRVYPGKYESYKQNNWNLYLEFTGKSFEDARVFQNYTAITTNTYALLGNSYVEISPGIQRIINSNTRIEFCYTFNLISYSMAHFPPATTLAVQRYFYRDRGKQ